ncbi:MAG: threonylcarbamoyl-AMP synthase [Leptospiraceae bacterium]|nr:threonylcarbamoyl-AMP synthase [Leptospiraceae bacterium]
MGGYLEVEEAAKLIGEGQCVALPTETVYGLACNALNGPALAHLFSIKGRPANNPVICHVSSPEMAFRYGKANALAQRLMDQYWPGPLTILLEHEGRIPTAVTAGSDLCGFRMPDHELALKVIELCDVPLAIPSANKSGKTSPVTPAMVLSQLEGEIPGVVDGGQCSIGLESTVVRLEEEEIIILRPGIIDQKTLEADGFRVRDAIREASAAAAGNSEGSVRSEQAGSLQKGGADQTSVAIATAQPAPLAAPGLLPIHYQPDVDLYLVEASLTDALNPGFPHASYETISVLNLDSHPITLSHLLPRRLCENAVLRHRKESAAAVRQLYLDLYELSRNSDALVVIAGDSVTEAMLDRLRRAATGVYRDGKWQFRRSLEA